MSKLPGLNAFTITDNRRCATQWPFKFRYRQTAGFPRSTVSSVYQEYMDGGQNTSDRANCKGLLILTMRGKRRLRRIVRVSETRY
ncbi:hypothetical protein TNCV_772141 [Trichonephila clavipes]|nr:hypothetical protein TNCV_772141 [Trichonephila clavipes]